MRTVLTTAVVMLCAAGAGADDSLTSWLELSMTGGLTDGPGYAAKAPTAGIGINTGTRVFRLRGSASGSLMHKSATPGGYWAGINGGAEVRFGAFSAFGGMTASYSDQTVWTKRVRYAYGGLGFRWAGARDAQGAPRYINEVGATYFRETFSTYANHAQVYEGSYRGYARLGRGPWYALFCIALGEMRFLDNPYPGAAHRSGMTSNFGVGLALRP